MTKFTRLDSASDDPHASREPTPNVPIHAPAIPWITWREGERFAGGHIPLATLGGAVSIGVNLVQLDPGTQSCPFHYHLREEEHFYVLSGRCVLRSGEERHVMESGDYVCFPAGTGVGHATLNPFAEPCRMLVVVTPRAHPLEVCVFPDSGEARIRALKA
ncbi:MAG: cupin domain-containing protein, partial [Myxococcales bacterium]|nr:cupin domain-containing protein [Myxococcales bacterium]